MLRVVAFDPGLSGAMSALDASDVGVVSGARAADMPTMALPGRKIVDGKGIAAWLRVHEPHLVVVELVGARPGQGVTSMFTFGRALGVVEGIVQALGYPLERVTPQVWQRWAGCPGVEDTRGRAGELLPLGGNLLARKKDIGRADALLMALWGLRKMVGAKAPLAPARDPAPVIW